MADGTTSDSSKQSTPYLTDFPVKVQHGWFRSGEPDAVVSCEQQPDAYICLNGGVNCRIVGKTGAYEWQFNVFTTGKYITVHVLVFSPRRALISRENSIALPRVSRDIIDKTVLNFVYVIFL